MVGSALRRYSVIECRITDHQPYGLVFETGDGTHGFVDRADISDVPVSELDWPPVGQHVTCVVLGSTRDGRVRASARPRYVALIQGAADPQRVLSDWIRIRDNGFRDASERETFFRSPDAVLVLQWALVDRGNPASKSRALELLAEGPAQLRSAVQE